MQENIINAHLQDCFVFLSITNTEFLKIVRTSVKPQYFLSRITEDIIQLCYEYFDQFNQAPQNHLNDELVRFLSNKTEEKKDFYIKYLDKINEMSPPNQEYIISRINKFIQAREIETSMIKIVELGNMGEFEKARELMQKVAKTGIAKEEIGIDYLDVPEPTYYQKEDGDDNYLIPTGFSVIDRRLKRGLRRTDLVCILAGYKGCKTWGCLYLCEQALGEGLNVLYITHEISAEEAEMRLDRSLGVLTDEKESKLISFETINENGVVENGWSEEVDSVFNKEKVISVRRKIARFGGRLIIKKYPMGRCTMGEMNRYLDYLETFEKFVPDVVVNDYVEKMYIADSSRRNDIINDMYIESKAIADERKLLMVTASQVTGEALERQIIGKGDAAEDKRKAGNVDLMLAITQSRKQSEVNRMQAWVVANRHGPERFGCCFSANLDVGQLVVDCWPLKRSAWE